MTALRTSLAVLGTALLLTACADHPAKTRPAPVSSTAAPAPTHATHETRTVSTGGAPAAHAKPLPDSTGVPACDDYLASYRACHRAAAIYAPDTIESHYQQMRQSLLRDSMDPDIRPQLASRCNSLAATLRQALHGKSCAAEPASAQSGTP